MYDLYFNISGDGNETQDFDYIYPSIDSLSVTDFPMNLTNLMTDLNLCGDSYDKMQDKIANWQEARKKYGIFTQILR